MRWTVRLRHAALSSLVAVVAMGGAAAAISAPPSAQAKGERNLASARVRLIEPAKLISDFELTAHTGKRMKFSALRGEPTLVFLGFTHCPDVCPATLHKLKLVESQMRKAGRQVQVVMLSVDGERDTPAALRAMLEPVSPRFVGLTGPPSQMKRIAAQFSGVFFKGLPRGPDGNYTVDHTSQIYLVDSAGALRAIFFNPDVADIVTVTTQLGSARG